MSRISTFFVLLHTRDGENRRIRRFNRHKPSAGTALNHCHVQAGAGVDPKDLNALNRRFPAPRWLGWLRLYRSIPATPMKGKTLHAHRQAARL
jgi:hypothetical protein